MEKIVRDETELMAALNAPGRALVYRVVGQDERGENIWLWIIEEYAPGHPDDGEILGEVDPHLAWAWSGVHDYPDPLCGPFSGWWSLPEHRLPEWPAD